jgi:hypothetical protein
MLIMQGLPVTSPDYVCISQLTVSDCLGGESIRGELALLPLEIRNTKEVI